MSEPVLHDLDARVAVRDRWSAVRWGARTLAGVLAVLGAMLGTEKVMLTHADSTWAQVDGFPAATLVELQAQSGAIVHIGDSVVQTAVTQPDHRLLPEMIAAEIHDPVHITARPATGADLHDAWLSVLISLDRPPRAVILGVNPRSFSPHWESNPPWVFRDEAAAMSHPLFARAASVLEVTWGRPTDDEYEATPVVVAGRVVGTVESMERGELGTSPPPITVHRRFVTRYAADYRRSRRIEDLRTLIRHANAAPFPVIFYITPIDVDGARACMTDVEKNAMAANLRLLRGALARSRWPHPDFSEAVRTVDFDHPPGDPHEHLRSAGRLVVAHGIASALGAAGVVDPPQAPIPIVPLGHGPQHAPAPTHAPP